MLTADRDDSSTARSSALTGGRRPEKGARDQALGRLRFKVTVGPTHAITAVPDLLKGQKASAILADQAYV